MSSTQAAVEVLMALAKAIHDLKEVPSGHLYAQVMGHLDLQQYENAIQVLKNTGLVSESNHLLTWIGPRG